MATKELFSKFKKNFFRLPSIALFISGVSMAVMAGSLYFTHKLSAQVQEVKQEEYADEPELSVGEEQAGEFSPFDVAEDGKYSVVFIGYGGAGHQGGSLADSIILFSADPKEKTAKLISIPRDLWVALPTDYNNQTYNKINAAFAVGQDDLTYANKRPEFRGKNGGANLLKYAVYSVAGIQVDNFIAVDFSGFERAIDNLGGIDVEISRTFDDYFYPVKGLENETCGFSPEQIAEFHEQFTGFNLEKQFTCRYEHIHFDKGRVGMDGADALKFVRSRHSASYGGDFARSERQFAVLSAIADKIFSAQIIQNGGNALSDLTSLVSSDIANADIKKLFDTLGGSSDYKLQEIHLSTDNVLNFATGPAGQFILVSRDGVGKWEGVQKYVADF